MTSVQSRIPITDREDNGRVAPNAVRSDSSDGFPDIEQLRMSQDFAADVGLKKLLLTVPVRKPTRQSFVRVHPDESYRIQTVVLELKDERETYLVDQSLWSELPGEIIPKVIFTAVDRQGVVFLWPVRLPGEDGRHDEWNRSALQAADLAMQSWVRVSANMGLGAYEVSAAVGSLAEPVWPEQPFQGLLKIAFRDRFIDSPDHPVVRRLRGEV